MIPYASSWLLFPALFSVLTVPAIVPDSSPLRNDIQVVQFSPDTIPPVSEDTVRQIPRLTVRPREMATGTQTAHAGVTPLEGFNGYYVYVPPACVSTTRAPLIVLLHGGGRNGAQEVAKFQGLADKYRIILLTTTSLQPGLWDVIGGASGRKWMRSPNGGIVPLAFPERDAPRLDSALTQVLRTHAIDPERIALLGFSNGGSYALYLGRSNLDVFSRIVALDALIRFEGIGPANPATQFFLSIGATGGHGRVEKLLTLTQTLRQQGHPVIAHIGLRTHADYVEDEDVIWHWLQTSWADPGTTTRVPVETETDPVLTAETLRQITTFWTRFQQLPDSIRTVLRMQHQIPVSLMIGTERTTIITMNLSTLAAVSPPVAALLDSVGLTAQTATAYRTAIIRAGIARSAGMIVGLPSHTPSQESSFAPIAPTSVLGRNMDFWKAHEPEFTALEKTGMWVTQ